jgi:prophage regulatory protein
MNPLAPIQFEGPVEFRQPASLLRLREVRRRTGKSRSGIYRGIADGTFPAPVKLGERASAWVESEIEAWIADRIAERDAGRGEA